MDHLKKDLCLRALSSAYTSNRGFLFVKNLSNDLKLGRVDGSLAKAFFTDLAICLKGQKAPTWTRAVQEVLKSKAIYLHCGPVHSDDLGEVFTTLSLETLENYYLDPITIVGRPPGYNQAQFFDFLGAADIPHLLTDAIVRGGRDAVWLAPWADAEDIFSTTAPCPNTLRSFLGLNHFNQDEFLVTLHFEGLDNSYVFRRPTSLDAGPNLIFRTDGSLRTFGYTVNLLTNGKGSREVIGRHLKGTLVTRAIGWGELTSTPEIDWSGISRVATGSLKFVKKYLHSMV
ncbi:hypothetical protein [Asticcacaulis biprosthecium]|uniref:hypothetical protein n=1 Tax=Asticcacaulis biprosthecium TaxID=76891 RepID=UPI00058DFE65|nr:hypothetical protein [Asticcacaulis biprosthecium]